MSRNSIFSNHAWPHQGALDVAADNKSFIEPPARISRQDRSIWKWDKESIALLRVLTRLGEAFPAE